MCLLFIKLGLSIVSPGGEGLPLGISVESKQADGEAQGVQHLVFHGWQQDLQFLNIEFDLGLGRISGYLNY